MVKKLPGADITMLKLSVIMVVRNEEDKIRKCLDSVMWADDIVIVDQSSTDNTVGICREYTDKVFVVEHKNYCEPDRPFAASKAKNDWILYVDADEEVPHELRDEIIEVLSHPPAYNSYYIPRKNIFLGRWIRGSGWYPAHVLRLFKKGYVKFPDSIHGDILPAGGHGYLKHDIIHITCGSLKEYMKKVGRYTDILAREMHEKGETLTYKNFIFKLLILPPARFIQKFFLKKGFMDGIYGLVIAYLTAFTVFAMYIKLWNMQKGKT